MKNKTILNFVFTVLNSILKFKTVKNLNHSSRAMSVLTSLRILPNIAFLFLFSFFFFLKILDFIIKTIKMLRQYPKRYYFIEVLPSQILLLNLRRVKDTKTR